MSWPSVVRHHALNVALLSVGQALPLVVTTLLSTTMTAYYYTAAMISGLVIIAPTALTMVLYSLGAAAPDLLARRLRLTLGLALAVAVVANGLLVVGARPLLSLFGEAYLVHGEWPLRLLGLWAVPLVIREHYVALCRIERQTMRALAPVVGGSVLALVLGGVGATQAGLVGVSGGALLGLTLEALYMAPAVIGVAAERRRIREDAGALAD